MGVFIVAIGLGIISGVLYAISKYIRPDENEERATTRKFRY
jgi:hypothetical protein